MARFFAKKTTCIHGHKHDSKAEANRCAVLHDRLRKGEIDALVYEPRYTFNLNGQPIKLRNGHTAGYKADFAYREAGKVIVEDVKPPNKYGQSRDVPLRLALFQALYPEIELRIVK